jgi:hypothetical protein
VHLSFPSRRIYPTTYCSDDEINEYETFGKLAPVEERNHFGDVGLFDSLIKTDHGGVGC